MFVPFITPRNPPKRLSRRKGGGGKGAGKSSSSSSGKTSSSSGKTSSSSSSSKSSGSSKSKFSTPSIGKGKTSSSYNRGGGKPAAIPAGQPFAGRIAGGATRDQIFGTRTFGSGYPGVVGRGVAGRGFPFYFWPIAWGGAAGIGTAAYLHSDEYGFPDNTTRPGGPIAAAAFQSSSTSTVYRVVADNATVIDLIADLKANCSAVLNVSGSSSVPSAYGGTPQPEQVVQYYRASTIALTLDGYNNTAALEAEGTPDMPLPSNIDTTLLDCLNQTIGLAAPLVDGANIRWVVPNMGLLGLLYVLWNVLSFI